MKKAILQLWEESEKDLGVIEGGCSLHLSPEGLSEFILSFYSNRKEGDSIPPLYEKTLGDLNKVLVSEAIHNIILDRGFVRLGQNELNNLLELEEIKPYDN